MNQERLVESAGNVHSMDGSTHPWNAPLTDALTALHTISQTVDEMPETPRSIKLLDIKNAEDASEFAAEALDSALACLTFINKIDDGDHEEIALMRASCESAVELLLSVRDRTY